MAKFEVKKVWWVVVIVIAAVGLAVKLVMDQWFSDYKLWGDILCLVFIGAAFCWAYLIDREGNWWAIIPGLGIFAVLAGGPANLIVGSGSNNDWVGVLVLGAGTVLIALILKRPDAKIVLIVVAMFTFLVGLLMGPFTPIVKGILIAADIVTCGLLAWWQRKSTTI